MKAAWLWQSHVCFLNEAGVNVSLNTKMYADDDDPYIYLLQQETDELKQFRADQFSWFVLKNYRAKQQKKKPKIYKYPKIEIAKCV